MMHDVVAPLLELEALSSAISVTSALAPMVVAIFRFRIIMLVGKVLFSVGAPCIHGV